MTTNAPVTKAYGHQYFGWLNEDVQGSNSAISENFVVQDGTIQIGSGDITSITVGAGGDTNIDLNGKTVTVGGEESGSGSNTVVKTENFAVGRYIYMNSQNEYSDTNMDSGLVMNIQESPDISMNVTGSGFTSSTTVEVDLTTGLLPNQWLAVKGTHKNDGLYQVVTHLAGVITINSSPEDFCKDSFMVEDAIGTCRAVKIAVLRANSEDNDTIEMARGSFSSSMNFHKMLYDGKAEGELGNIKLTDATNQILLNGHTTINAPGNTNRTHTIDDTASDKFTFNDATQILKNKTITDSSNNVSARGMIFNSGSATLNSYSSIEPTTGQFLQASGSSIVGTTLFTVSAGSGLTTDATGGGSTNTNVVISKATDQDDQNETTTTNGDPNLPNDPVNTSADVPGIDVPVNVTAAFAGVAEAFAMIAGAGGFVSTGPSEFKDDVTIEGDLTVLGAVTSVSSSNVSLDGPYMYLNSNMSSTTPVRTGIIASRVAGATVYNLSNFVAGDGSTDPQCDIDVSTLAVGDIIEIYSNTPNDNCGLFEVLTCSAGTLTVRGPHTTNLERFTKTNFVTDATSLTAVKITLTGVEFASTDGAPKLISGNNTSSLTKNNISYDTSSPTYGGLTLTSITNDDAQNKVLVLNGSDVVKYRTISNSTHTETTTIDTFPTGTYHASVDIEVRKDPIRGDIETVVINPFTLTLGAGTESEIRIYLFTDLPVRKWVWPILLYFDGAFEECNMMAMPGLNYFSVTRKNGIAFPAGDVKHCVDGLPGSGQIPASTEVTFTRF